MIPHGDIDITKRHDKYASSSRPVIRALSRHSTALFLRLVPATLRSHGELLRCILIRQWKYRRIVNSMTECGIAQCTRSWRWPIRRKLCPSGIPCFIAASPMCYCLCSVLVLYSADKSISILSRSRKSKI